MIHDYIIIGSGISGLYLGYLLNNKNYLILEKNNYIGGRIQHTTFHNTQVQLGAGVFQKYHKNVINLLKKLKLEYISVPKNNNKLIKNYNKDEYNNIIYKLKNCKNVKNKSMGNTLKHLLKDKKKISLFKKCFGYTDYLKADTQLTLKYYPIEDFLDKKSTINIIKGGNHKIIESLQEYSINNIKLNTEIISIEKNNDIWVIKDNKNNIYETKHIISTIDIKALKKLKINGINKDKIKYFLNMIGSNNFLRMYSYHDKIELNNSVIVPHIFKQMIPINNNVIMSAYCDNNNAKKSKKLLSEITNKDITKILQKYINISPVKDKIIKYWEVGTHYYKPSYNYKKNYYTQDNFSIVGEVIGYEQGWMEGAIHSVNSWLKKNEK